MKIGRNDPCSCGSGKKYKKCCYLKENQPPTPEEVSTINTHFQNLKAKEILRRKTFESKGIFIDFVVPVADFKGKSVWALGSRLYPYERAGITFHEFIISCLGQELKSDWINEQDALPLESRHFIMKCNHYFGEFVKKSSLKSGSTAWANFPDGWTKSLLSLAFDVACIIHVHGHVPEKMMNRLKLPDSNYQGARYEIAVAALFARMGCKFEFLDELLDGLTQTPGHCEFYATEPVTRIKVAVEAKSKVRKGVLHEPGESIGKKLWSNVTGPYRDALTQNPDTLPFLIFVDMNTPPTDQSGIENKPWAKEILEQRKRTSVNKPGKPDPCSAMVYTNYSYHYHSDKEAPNGEAIMVVPDYPKYPLPEPFIQKLHYSISGYSYIPNIAYDGSVQS